MVYLKSVEIGGFKSFDVDHRIRLTFDRGLTVLTGPIGSGKSNLVDAIRFVFCEPNPKALRVSSLGELLYETSAKRSTYAWVKAVLDNSDFGLPVNKTRIEIKRRLSARGSTYYLNGRHISRKRLLGFLEAAGISPNGFNIVAQGTVIRMAEVELRNLRQVLEQLTGIAAYDRKKREAEENLKEADHKIAVAEARIEEVRNRLKNLERERNDLLRYNLIREEVRELKAASISREISALRDTIDRLDKSYQECSREIAAITRLEEGLKSEKTLLEEKLKGSRLAEAKLRLIEVKGQIRQERRDITDLRGRVERLEEEIARLRAMEAKSSQALSILAEGIREVEGRLKGARERERALTSRLRERREALKEIVTHLEGRGIDEAISELRDLVAEISARVGVSEARRDFLEALIERLNRRKQTIGSVVEKLRGLIGEIRAIQEREDEEARRIGESIKGYVEKKAELEGIRDRVASLVYKAREALSRLRAQRELVDQIAIEERALREARELIESGVVRGVHGELGRLIAMDPAYRRALLASSMGWHRALVVEDLPLGLQLLRRLNTAGAGSVKVIPLKSVKPRSIADPALPGIVGPASSFVSCDEKLRPAVDFVWGDTLIAVNDDFAIAAASEGFRSVTIDGNVYEPCGVLVGGRFREPLELQILPSTHSLRKLQAMQARLERVLLERLVELSRLVDRIERLRARREMKISEVSHARASLLYATSNLTLCQDLLAIIERESRQAADQLEEERTLHDKLDEQRRALENRLSSLKRGRDLRSEVARLEKALAKAREDIAALTRTLKVDLYPKLEATKGKLSVTRRGIEVNRKRLEEMGLLLKEANESLTALREEKRMIGGELQGMERSAAELRLKLSSVNNRLEAVRETKNELISRKGRLYTDIALARQRLGSLTEQLYELGFKEPIAVSPEDVKRAEALRERLEAELTDIGAINYLAAKHYHEQMGKYKLISERINDLERDKRAILDFIERLEKEKRRVFTDAFTRVARRFSEFFAKITANGRGFLKLQDEENPLNGDIDMLIQLPGKSTISVSGASGGEKSIAVVSFILALGDLMRAPLYIFDEIDVHLDQFHVERLADVLKERSRSFQIIIVSRRSPVLAKADKVYGFFMQNDRSYVVSLPAQVTA